MKRGQTENLIKHAKITVTEVRGGDDEEKSAIRLTSAHLVNEKEVKLLYDKEEAENVQSGVKVVPCKVEK